MSTVIERLTDLENLVGQIKLFIEKRILNGLVFEDAMDGLYRDIRIEETRREQDPDRNYPGKRYTLPRSESPDLTLSDSTLRRTLSDETVDPGSPQSGYRSPYGDSGAETVDLTGTEFLGLRTGKYNLSPRSSDPSSRGGALKRRKKKGKKRRTNRR